MILFVDKDKEKIASSVLMGC